MVNLFFLLFVFFFAAMIPAMTQAKQTPTTWEELKALGPTKLSRIFGCPVTTAHAWIKRGGPPKWLPKILVAYANTPPETYHSKDRYMELYNAALETIMENLHLADGDKCTLKRLKDAIGFELPPENS